MSEIKLKPCPFCGGEAKYVEFRDFFIERFVTCKKCGLETRRDYLTRDKAIKMWNTRKPMERIVEKLEEYNQSEKDYIDSVISQMVITRSFGRVEAFEKAIDIVKEVGGV